MKIMLADDEMTIVRAIKRLVCSMDYDFCYATNGKDAINLFMEEKPDLIILDVMMPKLDGFDVCEVIRSKSDVPVIFLSAKMDIVDKTIAYKMGADDYLVKPFPEDELKLKISALLRRGSIKESKQETEGIFKYNDLVVDLDKVEVTLRGKKISLTNNEFSLLRLLTKAPGKPFTRRQIINEIWGYNNLDDINALTVFIRRFREKIEIRPSQPEYILTVWGVGYMIAEGEIWESV